MSVNGTFFNPNDVSVSKYTPVSFPVRKATGKTLQGFLSEYTPNTFLEAAYNTGNTMDISALILKFNNTKVTTTDFQYVIPELAQKYGLDVEVLMSAKFITKESVVKFTSANNQLDANVAFTLTVGTETALYAEFNGIQAVGQVSSQDQKIFGALSTSVIGTINPDTFKTSITGMTAASLQKEIQGEVDGYVSQLNSLLAAGIEIPTLFNISISGLDLECNDGYINGGIDVTPAGFLMIRDLMVSVAEEMRYIRRLNRIEEINKAYYAARAQIA